MIDADTDCSLPTESLRHKGHHDTKFHKAANQLLLTNYLLPTTFANYASLRRATDYRLPITDYPYHLPLTFNTARH